MRDSTAASSSIRSGIWRVRHAIRHQGVIRSGWAALRYPFGIGARRRSAIEAQAFDQRYGTETANIVRLGGLQIVGLNRDLGFRYQASDPLRFRSLIGALPIDHREYVFVDYGSGKGRALLLASEFPFRRIVGVEFSPELDAIAQQNVARFPSHLKKCVNIELLVADVCDYTLPPEPLVLYFYNPFADHVLRQVLDGVQTSIDARPRSVFLVFSGRAPSRALQEQFGLKALGSDSASTAAIYTAKPLHLSPQEN